MSILTELSSNNTIFFQCGCTQEVLVIEYDHKTFMADFAIYETKNAIKHKLSLWQRLRYCFYCLYKGYVYHDQIILNRNQLRELKKFLVLLDL